MISFCTVCLDLKEFILPKLWEIFDSGEVIVQFLLLIKFHLCITVCKFFSSTCFLFKFNFDLFCILQSAPVSSWTAGQQVLVGSWQQIPGLAATTQRPVPQPILQESLAPQPTVFPDNWRQSIVLDGFDQTPLGQLVSVYNK